jgi:hypothetical protein
MLRSRNRRKLAEHLDRVREGHRDETSAALEPARHGWNPPRDEAVYLDEAVYDRLKPVLLYALTGADTSASRIRR